MFGDDTRLFWLRDDKTKHPVACVASSLKTNPGHITYAIAIRNDEDKFERSQGRCKAAGRLAGSPVDKSGKQVQFTVAYKETMSGPTIKRAIVESIAHNPQIAHKARELAKHWLKQVDAAVAKTAPVAVEMARTA